MKDDITHYHTAWMLMCCWVISRFYKYDRQTNKLTNESM